MISARQQLSAIFEGNQISRFLTFPAGQDLSLDIASVSAANRGAVHVTGLVHIGKESNDLEEVQAWLVPAHTTYAHYVDEHEEWERDKQILRMVPRKLLAKWSGFHLRSIKADLNTPRVPYSKNRRILHEIAEKLRRRDPGFINALPSEIRGRLEY